MKAMLALALLLLVPAAAPAQTPAAEPLVRTTLDPAQGIVIGQPVRLDIQVLFPGEMPHPPLVSVPEAAGAQILRFETQATTIRDSIAGQDYVGQTFEFVLFPRRGGEIDIPAPNVTLLNRGGDPTGNARGEAARINVSVPAGIDPSGPVLVADRVSVEQSWSPDPGATQFRAGSALVRTIRRTADGVPALGMADFSFAAPDGVRAYVDPPAIDDRSNRGSVEGRRSDKVTYVFEKAGTYALPALSQPWWSLSNKQARTETLPGVTVAVAAGASPGPTAASPRPGLNPWWLAVMLVMLTVAVAFALAGPRLRAWWQNALQRYRSSEAAARRELLRASTAGSPSETYQALCKWLQRLPGDERHRARADSRLAPAIARLEQGLFGNGCDWSRQAGAALAAALGDFHRRSHSPSGPAADPLPPLNPAA